MTKEDEYKKQLFTQEKRRFLQELVDLALEGRTPSELKALRPRCDDLVSKIMIADKELDGLKNFPQKYSGFDYATQAILEYLNEVERPATKEEIAAALRSGGFRGGSEGIEIRVMRALGFYLTGKGRKNPPIKKFGADRYGLIDWKDDQFK